MGVSAPSTPRVRLYWILVVVFGLSSVLDARSGDAYPALSAGALAGAFLLMALRLPERHPAARWLANLLALVAGVVIILRLVRRFA
jgi:hypothetical protein